MSETSTVSASDTEKRKKELNILKGLENLRVEIRRLSNKINQLEYDLQDHKSVIDTMKGLEGSRTCFKIVGGILCQRTVKDVLPEVTANQEQLAKAIESLNQQLLSKRNEYKAYKDEHNIVDEHNNSRLKFVTGATH